MKTLNRILGMALALVLLSAGALAQDYTLTESGLPIVADGKLSISIMTPHLASNLDDLEISQIFEDMTGIDIEWMPVLTSAYEEGKTIMWASGDYPDIVCNLTTTETMQLAAEGVIIPLTQYVNDEYMPNLMNNIRTETPELLQLLTHLDGEIYSLPSIRYFNKVASALYINKTWLDELGLAVPTTTQEYYEALLAFKNNDVNNNGDPDDEIPLSWSASIYPAYTTLFGFFGCPDALTTIQPQVKDGVVFSNRVMDEYKEAVKFYAKLYAEGLIDPEVFTHDDASFLAKGKIDPLAYGSFVYQRAGAVLVADNVSDYVMLDLDCGIDGITPVYGVQSPSEYDLTNLSAGVITTACEDVDAAIRLLDLFMDSYWSEQIRRGSVGEFMVYKDGVFSMNPLPEAFSTTTVWMRTRAIQNLPRFSSKQYQAGFSSDLNTIERTAKDAFYGYSTNDIIIYPWMTAEQLDTITPIEVDLEKYMDEMLAMWISGVRDVEEDWDEYLAQLERIGLGTYLSVYQEVYDKYSSFE